MILNGGKICWARCARGLRDANIGQGTEENIPPTRHVTTGGASEPFDASEQSFERNDPQNRNDDRKSSSRGTRGCSAKQEYLGEEGQVR